MSRSPWEDKKTYKIVRSTVYIIEAPLSAPVRWYTEYHYNGRYIGFSEGHKRAVERCND